MKPSTDKPPIPQDIRRQVARRLGRVEEKEEVRILFACESGSRAWGFASADSDYDVRFLYLHPRDWYLAVDLERKRDVIERPLSDQIDLSGWDLRKALGLFHKSNPPLLEWLGSPIVYDEPFSIAERLRRLSQDCYSPRACMHHYLSMARGNFREYLRGEQVWTKKYFYVLRPVLAVLWLERGLGVVPTELRRLVEAVINDAALLFEINSLLASKEGGQELDAGPRNPIISGFLEREISRLDHSEVAAPLRRSPIEPLNILFRAALDEVW